MTVASPHPAGLPDGELLAQCEVTRQRRSGPGGQHRNKVETAIVIRHSPSGLRSEASERRSQEENRRVALFRLRLLLAVQIRRTPDGTGAPSDLWASRREGKRISVNAGHRDFPTLLAEALDALAHFGELSAAAGQLGVTSSQFIKLLAQHPPALQAVNAERQKNGLHPLKG